MKQILIALLLAFTTSTVINAQKQSSIEKDSTENVKVTLSKKTDTKADESNTTVTVIGVDTTDMDTTAGKDDNDLPFGNLSDTISGGILISIIAIVAVFGLPVFILFVIFFFRYKNRKARYRLAEQAIAAGQPLPENFIRENRPADQRSQGIKNGDRTFHLPLGDHRRVRNRSNRTAYHVYGHRPMDNRQQTTENR